MFAFNPLSVRALSDLLGVSSISATLHSLHSLLLVPDPDRKEDPVRVFHKSFPDFLTDPGRCTDKRFFVEPSVHHRDILLSCLKVMKAGLKRNICQLDDYVYLEEVKDLSTRKTTYIGDALEYACRFWTDHLASTATRTTSTSHDIEEVDEEINEFFTTSLLFWIEVLSLTGNLDAGVYAMNKVEEWYITVSFI